MFILADSASETDNLYGCIVTQKEGLKLVSVSSKWMVFDNSGELLAMYMESYHDTDGMAYHKTIKYVELNEKDKEELVQVMKSQ